MDGHPWLGCHEHCPVDTAVQEAEITTPSPESTPDHEGQPRQLAGSVSSQPLSAADEISGSAELQPRGVSIRATGLSPTSSVATGGHVDGEETWAPKMGRGEEGKEQQKQKKDGAATLTEAEAALVLALLSETSLLELAPRSPHRCRGGWGVGLGEGTGEENRGNTEVGAGPTTGDVGEPSPQFQHATLASFTHTLRKFKYIFTYA